MSKFFPILGMGLVGLLSGCKPDIQPLPVPLSAPQGSEVLAPCQKMAYGGFPRQSPSKKGTFFVCRDGYALNFDPERKTAQWAVEHLRGDNLAKPDAFRNIDDSRPDPVVAKKGQSQPNDFVGIGYEKAKLVPSDDFKYNDVLYSHTFYLTNAIALNPTRVDDWKQLEDYARTLAKTYKEVFVVSGSFYENGSGLGWVGVSDKPRASGKGANVGKIQVPTHYYKVILIPGQKQAQAFLLPNTSSDKGAPMQPVSLAALENLTQIRFSPDFSQEQRQHNLGF